MRFTIYDLRTWTSRQRLGLRQASAAFWILCSLCFLLFNSAVSAATLPNDIRLQQFDGLQWNWIELRPTNGSALTFDQSLQFAVAGEKQALLTSTTAITGSNATLNGWLKLSGQTNRLTVSAGGLLLDGAAVAGGGDTIWTNENGVISPIGTNHVFFREDGALLIGNADPLFAATPAATISTMQDRSINGTAYNLLAIGAQDGVNTNGTAAVLSAHSYDQYAQLNLSAYPDDGTHYSEFYITAQVTGNSIYFDSDGLDLFHLTPSQADGASAIVYKLWTENTLTNSGAKLLSVGNGTEKFSVGKDGLTTSAAGFAKGAFTGITTTNTFYSVTSDLLSTKTNVVVIQGGLITGWTVTP